MGLAAPRQTDGCLLHSVTRRFHRLDGRSGASVEPCPFAKPLKLQASLPSPWNRVAFASYDLQGSQLSRGVASILRLTFVAFQSRQTPSMTKPRSMLAGHDVHQGSHRKTGPRRTRDHSMFRAAWVARTNPSWAGLGLCFSFFSLLASAETGILSLL